MDLKKGSFCRVELLVRRLKIVRLVGRFKEGVDLRSYNVCNKFANKTEVWHRAIVWSILTMQSIHVISSMWSEDQCTGTNWHLEWLLTTPAYKPRMRKLRVWKAEDKVSAVDQKRRKKEKFWEKRKESRTRTKKRRKRRYTGKPESLCISTCWAV